MAESQAESFDIQDKLAHVSSLDKTPASLLQEYAVKHCLVLKYVLVHNGIADRKVMFKYRVTLGDGCCMDGVGCSKREAKHEAALQLLKQMVINDPELLETDFKQWDFEKNICSPFDCNIKVNAIGHLLRVCKKHRLEIPEFKLVCEEGETHSKLFTMSCRIGTITVRASHKTKMQAKHLAALQMRQQLGTIDLTSVMKNEPYVLDSMAVVERVERLHSINNFERKGFIDKDDHLRFQQSKFSSVLRENELFKQYIREGQFDEENPRVCLNQIVSECKMQLFEQFVSKALLGKSSAYFYMIGIFDVYPPVIGSSVDDDMKKAKNLAALNLIKKMFILLE